MSDFLPDPADPIDQYDYEPYEDELEGEDETADRRYRAVSPLAVLSLVCGALSFLTVLNWFFGVLPAAGIAFGVLAARRISRSPDELQGRPLALVGLGLSVVLWVGGGTGLVIRQSYLVPAGYKPISFATLQRDTSKPDQPLPPAAAELNDQRVFIEGYMYPGRQTFNIKEFIIVPNSGLCKFCLTDVEPTQMIRVEMVGDKTADYSTSLCGVGGKLVVDPRIVLGKSPYLIEADVFR
jgi:hypothetical protein